MHLPQDWQPAVTPPVVPEDIEYIRQAVQDIDGPQVLNTRDKTHRQQPQTDTRTYTQVPPQQCRPHALVLVVGINCAQHTQTTQSAGHTFATFNSRCYIQASAIDIN